MIMKTQNEVIKAGYQALFDSLGVVDAIRFLQFFQGGEEDYTKQRHQWLDNKSVDDVFQEIQLSEENDLSQYDEIIN